MTDAGAEKLIDHFDVLSGLSLFQVSQNHLSPEMVARLTTVFGNRIEAKDQKE